MSTLNRNNKKSRFRKGKKFLFVAVAGALSSQALAVVNIFADTPLHLQNSSTVMNAYGVKPNITFLIDASGSMNGTLEGDSIKCRSRTSIRKNASGRTTEWSPWSEYQYGFHQIPADTDDIEYRCKEFKKIDGVKDVLLNIVANYRNDMYFAFRPLLGTDDRHNTFYDTSHPAQYNALISTIKEQRAHGSTPTTEQIAVAGRNLVMNKLKYRCQKSYIVLLSDGEAKNQVAASDANVDGYFDSNWNTDKERKEFLHKNDSYKPYRLKYYTKILKEKSFGPYIYNSDFYYSNGNKIHSDIYRRTTDNAGKAWNSPDPLNGNRPFTQTAETFTIGVGLGQKDSKLGRLAIPYLENGAMPSGNFFNANSQKEIMDAFAKIFASIHGNSETITTITSATAPTVAISQSRWGKISITATTESGSWSSKICIRQITDKVNKECTAQPSFNNRQLLLNDGTHTYLYSGNLTGLNNDTFKISNNGKNQSEWLNGLLTWLSRSKPDDAIKTDNFVLDYRNRTTSTIAGFGKTRDLGDIIDNPIITAGDNDRYSGLQKYMVTSANDGMVYVFRSTNDQEYPYDLGFNFMPMGIERQSNDGSDLVAHYYKDLTNKNYGKNSQHPHRFLLNGGMVVQQTEQREDENGEDLPQQTFMLSTMGQAGRGAFAINIGGKDLISGQKIAVDNMYNSDWYHDVALFQTPTGANNYFGFTIGTPAIARLRVNEASNASATSVANHIREAAFISNGYNYSATLASNNAGLPSSESALYIYDILGVDVGTDGYRKIGFKKGELIAKLAPEINPNQNPDADEYTGGLSSPTAIDIDGDDIADIVYAADYSGNLYRFDLRSPDPALWTVHKIFSAGKPITSAPAVILVNNSTDHNPNNNNSRNNLTAIITFGTGSDIYQSDLSNKDQQTVYGIYDDLSITAPTEISKQSLLRQELTTSGGYRQLSENQFNPMVNKGWYFNLESGTGERVVTQPVTISYAGVVFARKYKTTKKDSKSNDPCQVSERKEENEVYTSVIQYNVKTGARLKQKDPHFNLDSELQVGVVKTIKGLYSFTVAGANRYNIGGNRIQLPLVPPGKRKLEECTRAPIEGVDTEGNLITANAPKCPIRFKRLSWREVKTGYLS
ncbi:PilC/PilY family type IV pilus protein [Snodgrassella gandavensis]|uniref:PilC/PilY family type IV pilus protein n=1 Tax=Snodgrassella gandavensis TaxID=2946698 RepID=UPI001EF64202|nr:PilC/PilY family type IV pilus protein [Snodgrassella gandavensis]